MATRCETCNGTGKNRYGWGRTCYDCYGGGYFPAVEEQLPRILSLITVSRGRDKGKLRRSRPKPPDCKPDPIDSEENIARARAYYVWRLARFHGGADVCMPVVAEMESVNDPDKAKLDAIAEAVARRAFGTDMAAAFRWGTALGLCRPQDVPDGLPAGAYPGGPAFGADKPLEELLEAI